MRHQRRFSRVSTAYSLWAALLMGSFCLGMVALVTPSTERVVVHFAPDSTVSERDAWLRTHDRVPILTLDSLHAAVIRTTHHPDKLATDSLIAYAEYDAPIRLLQDEAVHPFERIAQPMDAAPPPDPYYAQQWNLQALAAPDAWMRLPQAHDITVALIDSGICHGHPEFIGAGLSGYDFVEQDTIPQDEHGHGCGIAGIIGATRQNDIGIAGLLNGANLMALRVADSSGTGYVSQVAAALIYAADYDADIINLSLGTLVDTYILRRAVAYVDTAQIPIVAASGSDSELYYPAAYETVISVGSHDQNERPISETHADVYAPGVAILTTGLDDTIVQMTGTSAASAHITGLLALHMLTGDELVLSTDNTPELMATAAPIRPAGDREVKVFVIVYQSSTPLYDPLKLNDLLLSDMTRSTIARGYENPYGQPALEFVLAAEPVVVQGAPPAPDPNYEADYNYAAIYDNFDLCARIQQHEVDEVWLWGEANPAFGDGWEWVTNGPQLQWTWGSNVPDCGRTVTTMWFEYNRSVEAALHSYGHRMEGAFMMRTPCQFMTASYPWAGTQWLADEGRASECDDSLSDDTGFVARSHSNNGYRSACGDVHAPPNVLPGTGPYHYTETNAVLSMCGDWQRDGTATWQMIDCTHWNCNERDYQIWWKQNIPGIGYEHRDTDGSVLPNWYAYLYDMDDEE